ncbi:MAG: ribulose-phosphate 3-epimerase [Bacilli bacterium]|nr:ribulose-phosphate 3-epimerase [Bacilli bacterium]
MKIAVSFLSIKDNLEDNIQKLEESNIDYLHLDIMDGFFVKNKTWNIDEVKSLIRNVTKPLDVHLMVNNVMEYVSSFSILKPNYITFHYEAVTNHHEVIDYIKKLGIKVGMSIKPNTNVDEIIDYLPKIDLVLVMSVEPGEGGQTFIANSINKINRLSQIRDYYHYGYFIEVDGGINDLTIKDCIKADIVVVGSFITNSSDYQQQIVKLKNN